MPARQIKILVVGSGGREHALCWKLSSSDKVKQIYCAPGNGGTEREDKCENVAIPVLEFDRLKDFALKEKIDLVVIGPDNPLAEGIVDFLRAAGLRVFGPTKEEAKLEWSKAYAKEFMSRLGIPTPRFLTADSYEKALRCLEGNDWARVVKADGLALGKGVFVCESEQEGREALAEIFERKAFGSAGDTVLLEEKLVGEELSLLMLCDGSTLTVLSPCQDHKRRFDDDLGANTGGMGAYSPVKLYDQWQEKIETTILAPLRQALKSGGLSFQGVLYAGLMISDGDDPKVMVLEFNARFGDPETQAIMPLLQSDLAEVLWACTESRLAEVPLQWSADKSCCVVAVTDSYPAASSRGETITLPAGKDVHIFHAGTKYSNGHLVTDGGRILAVVATASEMEAAAQKCYRALDTVSFPSKDFRTDIARRAFSKCLSS